MKGIGMARGEVWRSRLSPYLGHQSHVVGFLVHMSRPSVGLSTKNMEIGSKSRPCALPNRTTGRIVDTALTLMPM